MKRNPLNISIAAVMTVMLALSMIFTSCKKKTDSGNEPTEPIVTIVDSIPANILPREIYEEIDFRINLYKGDTPPTLNGQYVSKPHALFYESFNPDYDPEYDENDTVKLYSDRYVAFIYSEANGLDFYGKQWDTEHQQYYEEHIQQMKITGKGDNFCCYYAIEGYPNGIYLKQSTIFSATLTSEGLKDFRVAVIMVENDGDDNYYAKNTYRTLGDYDGLAENNNWMGKKVIDNQSNNIDPFWMMKKKK